MDKNQEDVDSTEDSKDTEEENCSETEEHSLLKESFGSEASLDTEDADEKKNKKWYRALFKTNFLVKILVVTNLWIAYFLCNIAFSTIAPFYPKQGEEKGASPAIIGIIVGSAPLCVVILSPVIGYLLPRIGFVIPIFIGLLLVGCSYLLLGFVSLLPPWAFISSSLFLRIAEGVGTALFFTASFAIFPISFPKHIGALLAFFELSAGVGYGIGFPIGGALYKVGGFKLPFLSVGASVLLFTLPCALLARKINIKNHDIKKSLPARIVFYIFTDMVVIALSFSLISISTIITFFTPILEPFLAYQFHYNAMMVAMVFFISPIVYIIFNIVIGIAVDQFGCNRQFVLSGLVVGGSSTLAMGLFYTFGLMSPAIIIVYTAIAGIALSLSSIPIYSDYLQSTEKYLGSDDSKDALVSLISGLLTSTFFIGEFAGPLLGGALKTFISFPACAIVLGETILATGLLLFGVTVIERTTRRTQRIIQGKQKVKN